MKTETEKNALLDNLYNPEKKVMCPRCGNELIHRFHGNSSAVECKTPKCIRIVSRGI